MCDQQSLRSACAYAQSDQSLCLSLEYSMTVKLLTEHHLVFLSLKAGCRGTSESIFLKMPHYWKSHDTAHILMPLFTCLILAFCPPGYELSQCGNTCTKCRPGTYKSGWEKTVLCSECPTGSYPPTDRLGLTDEMECYEGQLQPFTFLLI